MTTIQGQITSCASSISQAAGLAALAVPDEEMQVSFDVMRKKVGREHGRETGPTLSLRHAVWPGAFLRGCLARRKGASNGGGDGDSSR